MPDIQLKRFSKSAARGLALTTFCYLVTHFLRTVPATFICHQKALPLLHSIKVAVRGKSTLILQRLQHAASRSIQRVVIITCWVRPLNGRYSSPLPGPGPAYVACDSHRVCHVEALLPHFYPASSCFSIHSHNRISSQCFILYA